MTQQELDKRLHEVMVLLTDVRLAVGRLEVMLAQQAVVNTKQEGQIESLAAWKQRAEGSIKLLKYGVGVIIAAAGAAAGYLS